MIRERLSLLSAPGVEPVSEADARIGSDEELSLLHGHLRSARHMVENWTGRSLISQGWRWMLDGWPGAVSQDWWDGVRAGPISAGKARYIELPKAPLISVTAVTLFNDADQGLSWPAANYFVDSASAPGRLVLRNAASAPSPQRAASGLQIDFTCGYGAAPGDAPPPLRQAVLMLAAHYFENREVLRQPGGGEALPFGLAAMLAPYRIVRL